MLPLLGPSLTWAMRKEGAVRESETLALLTPLFGGREPEISTQHPETGPRAKALPWFPWLFEEMDVTWCVLQVFWIVTEICHD